MDIAKKLIELEILSETLMNKTNNNISNAKMKILFFLHIYGRIGTSLLISKIGLLKTNLATYCKQLLQENLIKVETSKNDGREILYCITPKGEKVLSEVLSNLGKFYRNNEITTELKTAFKIILDFLNKKI